MHFLTISLFELGQFLRIVLWIALPMVMLSVLVTAYMQYRKKAAQRRLPEVVFGDAAQQGFPEVLAKLHPTAEELQAEGETVYQGLLWMKNKYERDRELADEKYGRLKEEFNKLDEKYNNAVEGVPVKTAPATVSPVEAPGVTDERNAAREGLTEDNRKLEAENYKLKQSLIDQASAGDMLEEKNLQIGFLQSQLDQRVKNYHQLEVQGRNNKERLEELQGQYVQALQLLDERQAAIAELQEQLQQGSRRSAALSDRLESGNRLLYKIRQELDHLSEGDYLPEEEPDQRHFVAAE